jgi:hypothetical protein
VTLGIAEGTFQRPPGRLFTAEHRCKFNISRLAMRSFKRSTSQSIRTTSFRIPHRSGVR